MAAGSKPTIVLVHGAFADASGWSQVFHELTSRGYPVYAPANPLPGVAADGQYIRTFISTLEGPVVLAGHSYGGCVITNASAGVSSVKALVYIGAYAPDEGETRGLRSWLAGSCRKRVHRACDQTRAEVPGKRRRCGARRRCRWRPRRSVRGRGRGAWPR
jgi:pimeloyl-ACP methyl ester carboxylesterase